MKTGDLLMELLCEEIPARMQKRGLENFTTLFTQELTARGLSFGHVRGYVTPRRITLIIKDLIARQPDRTEERRGPRTDAPQPAIDGFLKSTGFKSLDQCEKRETPKGEFWFANVFIKGQETAAALPDILQSVVAAMPWPKSMRWGDNTLLWVRPLQSVLCIFNGKQVEGTLDLGKDKMPYQRSTVGNRFHHPYAIEIKSIETYESQLRDASVIVDWHERSQIIKEGLQKAAQEKGGQLLAESDLIDELTGIVEWPIPLVGNIDEQFMRLPREALIASMRAHQRYAALEAKGGALLPYFAMITNIEARDGGKTLLKGNERVLRARLADASFFCAQDLKKPLEEHALKLKNTIFHAKLGTMADKVARLQTLVTTISAWIGSSPVAARRAAELCKADLMTEMVGEFPELQGIMGRYYALRQGETPEVGEAIAEHYSPQGPNDPAPTSVTGRILALADRLDTLVGFFAIGIKPTGSKDPFALRRAGLGVLRLTETFPTLKLKALCQNAYDLYKEIFAPLKDKAMPFEQTWNDLEASFWERLKVCWKERGIRHDALDAVAEIGKSDSIATLSQRVKALNDFLTRTNRLGADFLIAYRRACNIVAIEEKKDQRSYEGTIDEGLLSQAAERALYDALHQAIPAINESLESNAFDKAMTTVASLRSVIDAFFDKVTVNAPDAKLRENRLKLLSYLRTALQQVADFSKLEG